MVTSKNDVICGKIERRKTEKGKIEKHFLENCFKKQKITKMLYSPRKIILALEKMFALVVSFFPIIYNIFI